MSSASGFYRLVCATTLLTFCLVMLGAYVRLSDAGLGCPDWPGCYGQLVVPDADHEVASANEAFPHRPLEAGKAWKEMAHRYVAEALGLLIILLAFLAWRRRRRGEPGPFALPLVLVVLVIFQGILGMWTVTWQLKPLAVTAHLLGGMATLALLWLLVLRSGEHFRGLICSSRGTLRAFAGIALIVLVAQLFLGAWTSSNYAALSCPDFPTCQGSLWPETDFGEAFTLWRGLGVNYEYGVLDNTPRLTVHFAHRLGALLTSIVLVALGLMLLVSKGAPILRKLGGMLIALDFTQIAFGISLVLLHLPLPVAVAHNGMAALLLLTLVTLNHAVWSARTGITKHA